MSRVKLEDLVGEEILDKEIVTERGVVLIPAGTRMKPIYIEKLGELGIKFVVIKDEQVSYEYRKSEIVNECKCKVKDVIERHFYSENYNLEQLQSVATEIMDEVLSKPEVILCVDNMYHNGEDIYFHSINVCIYSILVALKMKLKKTLIKEIALGALLHDVGYNTVKAKLNKLDFFSKDEKVVKEIRKHVIYGYYDVQNEDWLSKEAKDIILYHHEKEDGTGYPFKKKGNTLGIGCKIVSICDEFDNCVNGKFKEEKKVYLAIEEIVAGSGTRFNSKVVEAFQSIISAYPNGSLVQDNYGDISVVVSQNVNFPTRPVLKVLSNKNNTHDRVGQIKDLTRELTVFIEKTLC